VSAERILVPLAERLDEAAESDQAYAEAITAARRLSAPLTVEERVMLEELSQRARHGPRRTRRTRSSPRSWRTTSITAIAVIIKDANAPGQRHAAASA
jgi:hypothetical protein